MSLIVKSLLGSRNQFNPEKFRAQMAALGGPASASSFYVEIQPPNSLVANDYIGAALSILSDAARFFNKRTPLTTTYNEKARKEIPRDLQFLAHTATIPGKTIQTTETTTHYLPSIIKMPTSVIYDDLTISFYARSGMLERVFFDMWQHTIINATESDGSEENQESLMNIVRQTVNDGIGSLVERFRSNDGSNLSEGLTTSVVRNRIGYYENYISTINVYYFDPDGEKTFKVKFNECYPTLVTPIELDWASNNEVVKLSVNFTYKNYELEAIQPGEIKRAAYFAKGLKEGNLRQAAAGIFQLAKSI